MLGIFKKKPLPRLTPEAYLQKLVEKGFDKSTGQFKPDPVPVAPPVGYRKQPSMVEIVRDMVQGERLRQEALAAGAETFEESEDFDIGDEDPDLMSGYENDFDPPLSEITREVEAERARKTPPPAPPSPIPPEGRGGAGGNRPPADSPPVAPEGPSE